MSLKMGIGLFFVSTVSAALAEYPAQRIDRTHIVRFGDALPVIEKALHRRAVAEDLPPMSRGIDKDAKIDLGAVQLTFDTGRLEEIEFEHNFDFSIPLAPFAESWCNLDPIDGLALKRGMKKADVLAYLRAWEDRAKKLGARRNDSSELRLEKEYGISQDEGELIDMVFISFGPDRPTGKGGGRWGSSCSISFVSSDLALSEGRPLGTLDSVSFSCDEFNSHARPAGWKAK
jgi:hypothetical protein